MCGRFALASEIDALLPHLQGADAPWVGAALRATVADSAR